MDVRRLLFRSVLKARDRIGLAAEGVAAAVPEDLADEIAAAKVGVGQRQRDAFGAVGGGHARRQAGLGARRQSAELVAFEGGIVAVALELEAARDQVEAHRVGEDRKSTRLN